jgi:hypothetical protein
LIASCLKLIQIFLNKERLSLDGKDKIANPERAVFTYVSFAIIWSLGANLHESSRGTFGTVLRSQIRQHFSEFPDGDVFENGINAATHEF